MPDPRVGSITIHGVGRIRVITDHKHRCVDIKIDGDDGATLAGLSLTLFGKPDRTPEIALLTPEQDRAEVSAGYRKRLDAASSVLGEGNIILEMSGAEVRAIMEP